MDKSSTLKLDPTTLKHSQLDGVACVVCHAEDGAMVPVGVVNGGQVFACDGCQDVKPENTCQPWCAWHDEAGNVCHADDIDGAGLTYEPSEGARVYIDATPASMSPAAAVAFGSGVLAQAAKTNPAAPAEPKPLDTAASDLSAAVARLQDTLPSAWEKAARDAADLADRRVRAEYESTMQAIKAERVSGAPAYWLRSFPCPEWCTDTDAHRSSDDPADRQHDSDVHAVTFETMRPSTSYATYQAPDLALGLTQGYREAEARVWMEMDGEPVGHASLDEAEQLAFHLLDLVRRARGLEPVQVLPFDSQGRCDDTACISCRRDTGKASA